LLLRTPLVQFGESEKANLDKSEIRSPLWGSGMEKAERRSGQGQRLCPLWGSDMEKADRRLALVQRRRPVNAWLRLRRA
jgi:hypothetical protein